MSINYNALFGQLALPDPEPTLDPARINLNRALAGFLAGYSGTTLDAYRLDLRQWITWLATFHTDPFAVERAHIELYARTAEQEGKARSTIGRRLSTPDVRPGPGPWGGPRPPAEAGLRIDHARSGSQRTRRVPRAGRTLRRT